MVVDLHDLRACLRVRAGHVDVAVVNPDSGDHRHAGDREGLRLHRAVGEGVFLHGINACEEADAPCAVRRGGKVIRTGIAEGLRAVLEANIGFDEVGQQQRAVTCHIHIIIFCVQRHILHVGQRGAVEGKFLQNAAGDNIRLVAHDLDVVVKGLVGDKRLRHGDKLAAQRIGTGHGAHAVAVERLALPVPRAVNVADLFKMELKIFQNAADAFVLNIIPDANKHAGTGRLVATEIEHRIAVVVHPFQKLLTANGIEVIRVSVFFHQRILVKATVVQILAVFVRIIESCIDSDRQLPVALLVKNEAVKRAVVAFVGNIILFVFPSVVCGEGNREQRSLDGGHLHLGFGLGFRLRFRLGCGSRLRCRLVYCLAIGRI